LILRRLLLAVRLERSCCILLIFRSVRTTNAFSS